MAEDNTPTNVVDDINVRNLTDQQLYDEFVKYSKITLEAEKFGNLTPELQNIQQTQDWETFSRARGYTEQEISDFNRYLDLTAEMEDRFPGIDGSASLAEGINYELQHENSITTLEEWKNYTNGLDTPTNVVDEGIELFHSRSKGIDTPRDFHAGTYQAAIDRSAFMFGDTNMYQLIKNTQELAQEQVNDMLLEIVSDSTGKFEDGKYLEREILVDLPNGNQQPVNVLVETIDDTGGYKVMILDKDNFGFTIYSEDGFGESPANKSLLEVNGNAVLVGEADDTFGYVAGFKPENKTFNYKDGYELYKVEIKPNANVVTFTENIELVENGVKQNIDPDLFVNYLEMNLLTDIDSITLPDGKTIDLQGLSDTEKRNKLKNNIDVIGYRNQMEDVGSTSYYFLNNDAYTETLVDNATNNKFDNDVLKKFIDTNPNVGITDFKRASDERLNIVTDLLSSKPDTPDRPFGPGAAHIEEILNANTQLVNELPLSQTVKNQFDNFLRTRARNLATPGGAIDAVDVWELGLTGLMIIAIAYNEFDEIPTIFKRTATNMFNRMTAPYNIPPVPLEEYDLDYEFINKVVETGEKFMLTDIIIKILDAMTKANAGGNRPAFESQVPAEAGDFADKVAETKVRRGEIR